MKGIFKLAAVLLACLPLLGPVQTAGADELTPEMVAYVKAQAEAGNVKAQVALGAMYDKGTGVPQDYAEARRWFGKAAAEGHAGAQSSRGELDAGGQGDPQD